MSGPVVIDARATLRREIGGVERLAHEMARRLPASGGRTATASAARPRPSRTAPGTPGSSSSCRSRRGAELIYCPANLAPLASRRNVVVIHDVAAARRSPSGTAAPTRATSALSSPRSPAARGS